jgi:hypothetical protein
MTSFFRRLIDRSARSLNRSAAGTAVPAGLDPPRPGERPGPTAHERTLMRRRLRTLRREHGAPAREYGHTRERGSVEAEIQTLEQALADLTTLEELLASGAFARCPGCGDLVAPRDPRCLHCGAELPQAGEKAPLQAPVAAELRHGSLAEHVPVD